MGQSIEAKIQRLDPARSSSVRQHLHEFLDLGTTWYQRWFFELRAAEELMRSLRYDQPLAVLALRIPAAGSARSKARARLNHQLTWIGDNALRITDMPGVLEDGPNPEYAILLPQTSRDGANIVAARLAGRLEQFSPTFGVAAYPEDGRDVKELFASAQAYRTVGMATVIPFATQRRRASDLPPGQTRIRVLEALK